MPRVRFVLAALLACSTLLSAGSALADAAADARMLQARGEWPAALQAAERALQARPQDATLRFLRAVALMELQRDAQALEEFQQISQQYPELPEPYNNIALLHARAGRLDAARLALDSALRNDPGHRASRINLGQVHLMLAARAFEQAAASGPADAALVGKLQAVRALLDTVAAPPPAAR